MVLHQPIAQLDADIVAVERLTEAAPQRAARAFDLHPALFAMTIGSYFAFLAVMALAFMNPHLVIPFGIFAAYIVMAFGVPGAWAYLQPEAKGRRQSWAEFLREGIATGSGHLSGGAAVAQVMTLPVLIIAWGLAVAVIKATV